MSEKKPKHYVNNADFLQALIDYKKKCDEAEQSKKPEPQIPNYIGECFLKIAEHLSLVSLRYSYLTLWHICC